ncbi:MAG TPA: DNA gyrase subunit A, partial [Cytophagales bacterium]|nr:DNA gyrase subunit A [Cytophagales bacterium]
LRDLIKCYVEHRHEVVVRRTQFELDEAERRAHILQGYLIALDNLDEVIELIRNSRDPDTAREQLMERFKLTEIQARAILDMRLQRLTGLEREKIQKEYEEVMALITDLKDILSNEPRRYGIIKDEVAAAAERFGDERRTEVVHAADEFTAEDMIPNDTMVITFSHQGYVKRTPLAEYRVQSRGGVGSKGAGSKDDDFTEALFVANNHNYLLIFTEFGKVFWLKVWAIPEGSKTSKGRPIQNLINIEADDKVRAVLKVDSLTDEDYINNNYVMMCTLKGTVKKTSLEAYSRPRTNGITAINVNDGDSLLNVRLTNGDSHIVIASTEGKAIHFHEQAVRPMGRTATGVRGIKLPDGAQVVGMVCILREDATLLTITEKGYGKRTPLEEYRITGRGTQGVKAMNITEKTGNLVAIMEVVDTDELMIINRSGITIRMTLDQVRVMGRSTQGVKLIRLNDDDEISSVARIDQLDEEEVEEAQEGAENEGTEDSGTDVAQDEGGETNE